VPKVSDFRIQKLNEAEVNSSGSYVLYWMIANRRTHWNYCLQRAVEWSLGLHKPLVVLEALRCDYQWVSDRLHRFVMEGMLDNKSRLNGSGVFYYPYLEPEPAAGKGLLMELSKPACVIVTDDFPCFFIPRMIESAARQVGVLLEKVDSNGILPIRLTGRPFLTALSFRRFLQTNIEPHLHSFPDADPVGGRLKPFDAQVPASILDRWPPAHDILNGLNENTLASFPIDHSVAPSPIRGGERAANLGLKRFLNEGLDRYADSRSHPDDEATSGLSPYLHFGHISVHQIFQELTRVEGWSTTRILGRGLGQREGWWRMSPNTEAFLDQLITWRELGFNMCANLPGYEQYSSLPEWALNTLGAHRNDPRASLYDIETLESADTHDPIWNAAQRSLSREGRLHNYLRMLWGKKILEWTRSPQEALQIMIHLNNKFALDGRDPNSYAGISWVLGRYDRPWAPERPVFGRIRYMSSQNTSRKLRLKRYLRQFSE
jgi:deoxyribodipyrimidine photo-lyase